jgi:hypothetical protein
VSCCGDDCIVGESREKRLVMEQILQRKQGALVRTDMLYKKLCAALQIDVSL